MYCNDILVFNIVGNNGKAKRINAGKILRQNTLFRCVIYDQVLSSGKVSHQICVS